MSRAISFEERLRLLYLDRDDARAFENTFSRQEQEELQTSQPQYVSRPPRAAPSRSSASTSVSGLSQDRASSGISTESTAPSNFAPPWHVPLPQTVQHVQLPTFFLPCEFIFVGCQIQFHPDQTEEWIAHTISHFRDKGPPLQCICIFCDSANFKDRGNPIDNWRKRMLHIGQHFADGKDRTELRPDFFVIEYMWANGFLAREDYEEAMKYTEAPHCDNLVPRDFKTEEIRLREERSLQEVHDLQKEARLSRQKHAKRQKVLRGSRAKSVVHDTVKGDPEPAAKLPQIREENGNDVTKTSGLPRSQSATNGPQPSSTIEPPASTISTFRNAAHDLREALFVPTRFSSARETKSSFYASPTPGKNDQASLQDNSSDNSTPSGNETDWEQDSEMDVPGNGRECLKSIRQERITKAIQELKRRMMEHFWAIFNENWSIAFRQHGVSATCPAISDRTTNSTAADDTRGIKRARDHQSDDDLDEDSWRKSKPSEGSSTTPGGSENLLQFACPFRKYNARKYCVKDWRTCALTSHKTVGRVKAHLYRYHLIYQCPRCKTLFSSDSLLDSHMEAEEGCDFKTAEPVEGIPRKMKERIQSRKKTFPGQTEVQRWEQIYDILFPNADRSKITPFFEPVRDLEEDEQANFSNPTDLADVEEHLRREIPRLFRQVLDRELNAGIQPLEEKLRGQVPNLMQEALDLAFSSYRARFISSQKFDHNPVDFRSRLHLEESEREKSSLRVAEQPLDISTVTGAPKEPDATDPTIPQNFNFDLEIMSNNGRSSISHQPPASIRLPENGALSASEGHIMTLESGQTSEQHSSNHRAPIVIQHEVSCGIDTQTGPAWLHTQDDLAQNVGSPLNYTDYIHQAVALDNPLNEHPIFHDNFLDREPGSLDFGAFDFGARSDTERETDEWGRGI